MTQEKFEKRWLEELRDQAHEGVSLFENPRKQERERLTCIGFLRCVGVRFDSEEVVPVDQDPPDVEFGGAKFEVMMIPFPLRRRPHADWKERRSRLQDAASMEDLLAPYEATPELTSQQVVDLVACKARKKLQRYERPDLFDLLVYVNGKVKLEVRAEEVSCPKELRCWRSVSILLPPYGYVVHASCDAPSFLCSRAGIPHAAWAGKQGLFDL